MDGFSVSYTVCAKKVSRLYSRSCASASRARSSRWKRPNTVGPVPLILAPSAPHWIRVLLISCTRVRWRSGRASSNTLYSRRATPSRSPASRAATAPRVSG